jgi:hypothetical protein
VRDKLVAKAVLWLAFGAALIVGAALVVGAQGPPPPPDGFGGPMGGMFEFGGLMGGFGGKVVTGKPILATITITHTETLPGNMISSTSTGTLARGADGSTYRDANFTSIGPWAASGKPRELAYIRNLAQGAEYFVNVTKGTYWESTIGKRARRAKNGGKGRADSSTETATDNPSGSYTDPVTKTVYPVDDRKTTRTIPAGAIGNQLPIVITSERWYSSALDALLQDTHSDPRFGTTTYQLSNIGQSPAASLFLPDPSFSQITRGFGKGRHGGPGKEPPPPPPGPQD